MPLRGMIFVLLFIIILLILYIFTPKPNAWLTRLAQRRGGVIAIFALVIVVIFMAASFSLILFLNGNPLFLRDLTIIAFGGILGGGLLQFMAAAVLPNSKSDREQRGLQRLVVKARREAKKRGLDPDEAEEITRRGWAETGLQIGKIMTFLHDLIAAFGGGGLHGGMLFILGASFFIGLGFGVSGSAVSLFYIIPILVALADTTALYAGNALIQRANNERRKARAMALSLPIGLLGMLCKAVLIVAASAALHQVGGPKIPWYLYVNATIADPFGQGLTTSVLFLAGLAWPVLLFVGPVHREFTQ